MSNYPVGRRPRSADPNSKLRLAALTAVVTGVLLLAAAAFVLSYSGIHQVALQAGVSPGLAKLYPVIFDAMLVIAGAAAMALRGAGWWSRFYAWACLILLLAAVATGDAVHATGTVLPARAARAAVAITPWVLLLLAFGLLLTMLRHFRKARAAAVQARQAALAAGAGGAGDNAAGRAALTWAGAGGAATAGAAGAAAAALPESRSSLVKLLEPRTGQAPAVEMPYDPGAAEDNGQHDDPVSYGEETGYVHPDSYRDEGEYSPHGDSGGPGRYAGPGGYLGHAEPAASYPGAAGHLAGHGPAGAPGPASGHDPAGENGLAGDAGLAGEGGPAAAQEPAAQEPVDEEPADEVPHAAPAGPAEATAEHAPADEHAPAAEHGQDGATAEPPSTGGPGLERMWSTPTRPEE